MGTKVLLDARAAVLSVWLVYVDVDVVPSLGGCGVRAYATDEARSRAHDTEGKAAGYPFMERHLPAVEEAAGP